MRAQKCGLTNLTELSVGDQQGTQGLQTIQGLVAILLGAFLLDGGTRLVHLDRAKVLRIVDELLQQMTVVLAQDQLSGVVDDIAQVLDQLLAFLGQLLGGVGEGLGVQSAVQCDVALLVRRHLAMFESCMNARASG